MTLTSATYGTHLARKSRREANWAALILRMVHKSLGPEGAESRSGLTHVAADGGRRSAGLPADTGKGFIFPTFDLIL